MVSRRILGALPIPFALSLTAALVAACLALGWSARAAELAGVTLPDRALVGGKVLELNGLGLRKATVFAVKVYVGALYLEKKSRDAQAILDSHSNKRIVMSFVRSVSKDKITEAWDESLKENCEVGCVALRQRFDALKSDMTDVKSGDTIEFNFLPEGVEVVEQIQGQVLKKGVIPGDDFARQLLLTWLGNHPPNEDLKKGMLGL